MDTELVHIVCYSLRNSVSKKVTCGNHVVYAEILDGIENPGHYAINFGLQNGDFISFGFDLAVGVSLYVKDSTGATSYKEIKWDILI